MAFWMGYVGVPVHELFVEDAADGFVFFVWEEGRGEGGYLNRPKLNLTDKVTEK